MRSSATPPTQAGRLHHVVLFSGGRGSGALTRQLLANPRVKLTLVINGYDDGASTGAVRRFLGDSLGPSDFRKNASRVAAELGTAGPALLSILDSRLPADATPASVCAITKGLAADAPAVADRLRAFQTALDASSAPFPFDDCSVGNLVFAGCFLRRGRRFNDAVDDYCALLGLPPGVIENVTDGTNAWLAALDDGGRLIATEEALVQHAAADGVREIFLLDRPLCQHEIAACGGGAAHAAAVLAERSILPPLNPRLKPVLAAADLIIYAAGTQHSSLLPSYLTAGLNEAIAGNLGALKLLLTNIQPDAEIRGHSAVDLVERAAFYLKEKGRLATPTPCLITHYLLNDPAHHEAERPYVPLGRLDLLEDPRLVRIGNYEDGVSGRHDAERVLTPFLDALGRRDEQRVAVLLYGADSSNKLAESLIEIVRGGLQRLPLAVTVFYAAAAALDPAFAGSLPFGTQWLIGGESELGAALAGAGMGYVVLFESSGMYRGEDLAGVAAQLSGGRVDAVWGSRRLSLRDIEASYRLRYRHAPFTGLVSFLGSHLLSLAYLLLFGRYISDSLSGVRAIRAADFVGLGVDPASRNANHEILSALLKRKADILEVPVQFLALSPDRVQRTSIGDGLRALATLVRRRFSS